MRGSPRGGADKEPSSPARSRPTPPAEYAALQSALVRWITRARKAGLDEDDVSALLAAAVHSAFAREAA